MNFRLRNFRRSAGKLIQKAFDGVGDFQDCAIEDFFIGAGGFAGAAHFANELKRGGGDFVAGGRCVGNPKNFDAAAHTSMMIGLP